MNSARSRPGSAAASVSVARPAEAAPFERSVFVNCPFDTDFLPLLHAMLFAIHDCGFIARVAVEDTGAREMRIDKIIRIIGESCYSIHDISRVELSATSKLPRFNMPFEAGLAMGAIRFGPSVPGKPKRDMLLLDAEPYRDKQTLSDLAGQDPKAHGNDPKRMIAAVRGFLAAKAAPRRTRGGDAIHTRFERFKSKLPTLARKVDLTTSEIQSFEYLPDWISLMAGWVLKPPPGVPAARLRR